MLSIVSKQNIFLKNGICFHPRNEWWTSTYSVSLSLKRSNLHYQTSGSGYSKYTTYKILALSMENNRKFIIETVDIHIKLNSDKKILIDWPRVVQWLWIAIFDACNWVGASSSSWTRMETHPNHYVLFGIDQKPHHTKCNTPLSESFKIYHFNFLFRFLFYFPDTWNLDTLLNNFLAPHLILSCILVTRHEHILHISAFTSRISSLLASNRVSVFT
jgi:hypothetical protein